MTQTQAGAVQLPRADAGAPPGLELRHLRYFVALAEVGSFTHAAERMFIAQPTLSQQIRRLEEIVGAPLLRRGREGLRLTAAGTVLLDASRDVLSLVDHGMSRTRQVAGLGRQRLRVVMPPSLPEALAVTIASRLRSAAETAGVDVAWLERPLDAEFSLIQQRQADAGLGWLTTSPAALPTPLDVMSLGEFEPEVWIPRTHPAGYRGTISLGELAGMTVIHGPRRTEPGTYDAWTTVLRGVDPRFAFTDPPFRHSLPMALAFAAAGDRPAAVLTGPAVPAGAGPGPTRPQHSACGGDMAPAGLKDHPLTATAALVWSGDLPRPLQQILFDTADDITSPTSNRLVSLAAGGPSPRLYAYRQQMLAGRSSLRVSWGKPTPRASYGRGATELSGRNAFMFKSSSTSLIVLGILAVVVGIIAIAWPSVTILALVILFAVYAFMDAGLQAARAFSSRNAGPVFGHLLLALISLAAGVVALVWPGPTAYVLVIVVAAWALVGGVVEVIAGFGSGEAAGTRALFIISGLVSVAFGILLFARPGVGAVTLALLFGLYSMIYGFSQITAGVQVRQLGKSFRPLSELKDAA